MNKKNKINDDPITFTLGKGNQSSICGGIAPMAVDSPTHNLNTTVVDWEKVCERENGPDADTEMRSQ